MSFVETGVKRSGTHWFQATAQHTCSFSVTWLPTEPFVISQNRRCSSFLLKKKEKKAFQIPTTGSWLRHLKCTPRSFAGRQCTYKTRHHTEDYFLNGNSVFTGRKQHPLTETDRFTDESLSWARVCVHWVQSTHSAARRDPWRELRFLVACSSCLSLKSGSHQSPRGRTTRGDLCWPRRNYLE